MNMESESSNKNNNNNPAADVDSGFTFSLFGIKAEKTETTELGGIQLPSKRDDLYYNMNNPIHGRCIILNYEIFDSSDLNPRRGTQSDVDKLRNTFKNLNFIVESYNDLTQQKTFEILKRESQMDHSPYNCFVICILTHGSNGILYSKDKAFDTNRMFEYFTGRRCPTLVGKPKLFFIQACQGENFDSGVLVHDSPIETPSYFMVPNYADFLIFFSTFPGYYSWRNVEHGSWFIQTVCEVFDQYSHKFDLMTLLTIVCQKVAINFESRVPNNACMNRKKQIPCIMSTLTRLLSF